MYIYVFNNRNASCLPRVCIYMYICTSIHIYSYINNYLHAPTERKRTCVACKTRSALQKMRSKTVLQHIL